jgi:general stress protein 26
MDEPRRKLVALLKRFDTAMLVTRHRDLLETRPMQIAQVEDDGRVWFLTDDRSRKADEIAADADVLVVCQQERSSYVAVQGIARLHADKDKVRELWKEPYRAWFPEGTADPHLTLIAVEPRVAEYWDNAGVQKLKYLFEAARAYASGDRPKVQEGEQHGRMDLQR